MYHHRQTADLRDLQPRISKRAETFLGYLLAAAIAVALGASHLLDGPDEIESARLDAQSLQDARIAAAAADRRERAAARFCAEQGAVHRWMADGDFACTR